MFSVLRGPAKAGDKDSLEKLAGLLIEESNRLKASSLEIGFLRNARVTALRKGEADIAFDKAFVAQTATKQDLARLIAHALESLSGEKYLVNITQLQSADDNGPRTADEVKSDELSAKALEMREKALKHPNVRAAMEIFGGRLEDFVVNRSKLK